MAKEVKNIDPGHIYGPTIPLSELSQEYTHAHSPRVGDISLLNNERERMYISPLGEYSLRDEYLKIFPFTD